MKDMEVQVDYDADSQNRGAFIVSHPKYYKAIIIGARDKEHAKKMFAEEILKSKK